MILYLSEKGQAQRDCKQPRQKEDVIGGKGDPRETREEACGIKHYVELFKLYTFSIYVQISCYKSQSLSSQTFLDDGIIFTCKFQ